MTTIAAIVKALGVTYNDDGVAIWLASWNRNIDGRPIDLCRTAEGRERVAEAVARIDGVDPAEFGDES